MILQRGCVYDAAPFCFAVKIRFLCGICIFAQKRLKIQNGEMQPHNKNRLRLLFCMRRNLYMIRKARVACRFVRSEAKKQYVPRTSHT
jgi:hypothetical protein